MICSRSIIELTVADEEAVAAGRALPMQDPVSGRVVRES
jgi:hypothetical protein